VTETKKNIGSIEFGYRDEQRRVDEHFNAESSFWREIYRKNDLRAHILRQRQAIALNYIDGLSFPKTARVLEIGCGAGVMTVSLARRGFTVNAVDHAIGMIEQTRRFAKQSGFENQIYTTIEDAHEFTFNDNTFDLVIAVGVIHWLHNLRKALVEITRVLKPEGIAVLSVDTRWGSRLDFPMLLRGILKSQLRKVGFLNPLQLQNTSPTFYSAKQFNQYLYEVNLMRIKNTTMGFLPITLFNRQIVSDKNGFKIHYKLQKFADCGYPVLRSWGAIYIVLTRNIKER
jgi:ubiquinone/menaquinone biosynthesis C-methylase UbiE